MIEGGSGVCRWASVSESSNDGLLRCEGVWKLLEDPKIDVAGLKKLLDAKGFGRFIGALKESGV